MGIGPTLSLLLALLIEKPPLVGIQRKGSDGIGGIVGTKCVMKAIGGNQSIPFLYNRVPINGNMNAPSPLFIIGN